MSDRFRVSSTLLRRVQDLGVSTEVVLRAAGLSTDRLLHERLFVSTRELFELYRCIERESGELGFGLRIGREERLERYDPVAIAALCASSLGDALERMARYKQLTCPEAIHITRHGDECHVRFEWLLSDEAEPAILIDLCFAWVVEIARRGSGGKVRPRRIELEREEAARPAYEQHFGCQLSFGQRQNVLVFDAADLEPPFVTHNAEMLAAVAPQLEAELQEQQQRRTFREQAKASIKRALAGRRPDLRSVARELGLSTRTLQRRLTAEQVTFQQLLAEARRELARHYLRHSSLELNETAYLLGYEDANSFFRAFQQWEGTSPGEWRAQAPA